VGDWSGKFNVTETFTPYFGLNNLHTAFLANDTSMFHPFVLAAVTFKILDRAKDFSTEEAVSFRLECSIVDCLRLFYLTMRPIHYFFRRSQGNPDTLESNGRFWFLKKIE
jgi:hypothetical protein